MRKRVRNENVLYLPFHVTQKAQASIKTHGFPASPGAVAKGGKAAPRPCALAHTTQYVVFRP